MKQIALLFSIIGMLTPINSYTQSTQTVPSNYSPLHWAATQGYVEMMRVLVDKGYNINAQDINGFTPLHYAAAAGSFQGVEYLVDSGADVYLVNKKNITPMTLAAQAGEQKIVDFLFVRMRSTRISQLKEQSEKERINTDLVQAAKARAEAERLRQQAAEWTQEAEYWRTEAEKWTREANTLKDQQIQIDQLAKERYDTILQEKLAAEENFAAERLARNAAERVLREQSANTTAQIRAYEAQLAALAAQRATDIAIDNLAGEFLKLGVTNYTVPNTSAMNPNVIPIDILNQKPTPENDYSVQLNEVPPTVPAPVVPDSMEEEPMMEEDIIEETAPEDILMEQDGTDPEMEDLDATYYYDDYDETLADDGADIYEADEYDNYDNYDYEE